MDTETAGPGAAAAAGEGQYLRRAQALLAARAELFPQSPARSVRLAVVARPPLDGAGSRFRPVIRQLTLPLPRERSRRRARMVR